MTYGPAPRPLADRFWPKVEPSGSCWFWTGGTSSTGYGVIGEGGCGGRSLLAHRVAYELLVGPIPDGHHIDHLCRVKSCVNPDHLEPVTPRDNTRRAFSPAAVNARKTECHAGHAFDDVNTWISAAGRRHCRACSRERARRLYHANKETA